jgi:non-specific serine/threonine protein kinase
LRDVIGRDAELDWLAVQFDPNAGAPPRLWSVTGPGGIGKSVFALALAHRLSPAYGGRVRIVNLEQTADPAVALATVCEAFGLTRGSEEENLARLTEHLAGKPALLILDGYEQLVDRDPPLALRLVQEAPSLRILATSRRKLGLNAERSFPLSALDVPPRDVRLKDLASVASVRLFVDRAAAQRPEFALSPTNAEAVAEICRRLDGMPLAIELAAAQVAAMSPAQLLGRIGDKVLQLTGRWRDAPERHRDLSAVVAWSYELLSDRAQRLFRTMGVLRGGSTLETLESMAAGEEVLRPLEELVAASLVVSEEGGGGLRFRMLEPIRAFAEQSLTEHGERDDAVRRHRKAYAALAERLKQEFEGPNVRQAIRHIEAEHDNLRALAERALDEPVCPPEALFMVSHLMQFFTLNGHYREWLDRTTQLLERPLDPAARNAVAGACVTAGSMAIDLNDFETALHHYGKGLALAEESGDKLQIARALNNYSIATIRAGRFEETEANLKRALEIVEPMDDSESPYVPLLKIVIRVNLGDNYRRAGDYARAVPYFEEGMERAEAAGNLRLLTNLLLDLSNLRTATGETGEALRLLEQADTHNREVSSQELHVRGMILRGMAHLRAGDLDMAWEWFVRGCQGALQGNSPSNVADGLYGLALTLNGRGAFGEATEVARLGREVDPASGGLLSQWASEQIERLLSVAPPRRKIQRPMRDPQVVAAIEAAARQADES